MPFAELTPLRVCSQEIMILRLQLDMMAKQAMKLVQEVTHPPACMRDSADLTLAEICGAALLSLLSLHLSVEDCSCGFGPPCLVMQLLAP